MPKEIHRTPLHVLTRELDRLVHQGRLRDYRVLKPHGKRRFILTWEDGALQEVGVAQLDSILTALAQGEVS